MMSIYPKIHFIISIKLTNLYKKYCSTHERLFIHRNNMRVNIAVNTYDYLYTERVMC